MNTAPFDYNAHRVICNPEGDPYLVRFTMISLFGFTIKLHVFVRGDEDRCLHDHPWWFISIILLGGYFEETPTGKAWYRPGRILFRPAEWKHRVILKGATPACTLVMTGRKSRSWGFWTSRGWVHWKQFLTPGRGGHEC